MEIRNALQKIENYLTVVSNLNKTILAEGTMSRDELLLMKKYLYTSIDRIEDIERLLIIDRKEEKSFSPTKNYIEDYVPPKAKEIVEVVQDLHIDEIEAALIKEENTEVEESFQEITAEIVQEETEFLVEIKNPGIEEEEVEEKMEEVKADIVPAETELAVEFNKSEITEEIVEENESEYLYPEEGRIEKIEFRVESTGFEIMPVIENIITEDFAINELKETVLSEEENKIVEVEPISEDLIVEFADEEDEAEKEEVFENEEIPLIDKITESESIATKFEEYRPTTFVEALASQKNEEPSFFEQLNQKLEETPQKQLFEMFDDGLDEFHETFSKDHVFEPNNTNYDNTGHTLTLESVLVVEKKEELVIEQLTPSGLNDAFKPQTSGENVNTKLSKTFSESIALNDKFIFVRELFGNQFAEYENGLKQLDLKSSFPMAESYCRENLWNKFNWNDKASAVERFMELLQKRFI